MSVRFTVSVHLALTADLTADPSTWTWDEDITTYVMTREGGITIRRGRLNEQVQAQPSTCTMLLNNRDGRFSRLNPSSTYYGRLRKGTPIRVRINPGGGLVTRFVGFVSEWPVEWDQSETDFWVRLRADGVLRRVGQ